MRKTSASGYYRWLTFFEMEVNEPKPEHYYYAQLASEIACLPYLVWGKAPPKEIRELKNWILKFGDPEEIARKAEEMAIQRAEQDAELSRSIWLGAMGIQLDEQGKPVKREKGEGPAVKLPPHVRMSPHEPPKATGTGAGGEDATQAKPEPQKREGRGHTIVIKGGGVPST